MKQGLKEEKELKNKKIGQSKTKNIPKEEKEENLKKDKKHSKVKKEESQSKTKKQGKNKKENEKNKAGRQKKIKQQSNEENKDKEQDRENKEKKTTNKEEYEDQVEGRNAVLELLKSGKDVNKIYIEKGEKQGSINKIIEQAKERKIVLVEIPKTKFNAMAQTSNAQGVIATVPPFDYCDIYDIMEFAKEKKEELFILILDGIEDPHNLGSIIRTAETAGVHGIIIPKRRAVRSKFNSK